MEQIAADGFDTADLEQSLCIYEFAIDSLDALANVGMVEDADCEVWHYVGIHWREVPNLDGMTQEELIKINDDPTMPEKLREYSALKWRAMQARKDGHVRRAMDWERAAESTYKLLPESMKW